MLAVYVKRTLFSVLPKVVHNFGKATSLTILPFSISEPPPTGYTGSQCIHSEHLTPVSSGAVKTKLGHIQMPKKCFDCFFIKKLGHYIESFEIMCILLMNLPHETKGSITKRQCWVWQGWELWWPEECMQWSECCWLLLGQTLKRSAKPQNRATYLSTILCYEKELFSLKSYLCSLVMNLLFLNELIKQKC